MDKVLFSSKRQDWQTPAKFYDRLDEVFDFTLDACANEDNALAPNYFSEENSCLENEWTGRVFCNPPYADKIQTEIVLYGIDQYLRSNECESLVFLIPSRTDTKRWQEGIFKTSRLICFLKERVRYEIDGVPQGNPAFPSALVFFGTISPEQYQLLVELGSCR